VCLLKLVIAPALAVSIGIAMGLTGMDLGILFLLMATPTAVASFIVAQTLSNDAKLAGSLVVMTTILSSITLPIGIALLVHGGWLSV
jgi:predicted permease